MEFREALDQLGERVTHEEVASALGVSVASVRQYRLSTDARAHRSPPAGWPEALSKLAEARGEELIALAKELNKVEEPIASSDYSVEFRRQLIENRCAYTIDFAREGLKELKFYVATLEDCIAREEALETAAAELHAHRQGIETGGDFWAENHPYWWEQIFASRLRSGYIISLMATVEHHLREVCRDASIILNTQPQEGSRGRELDQFRRFLRQEAGFTVPHPQTWESIGYVYDVRNAIVHNGGMIGIRNAKARERIRHLAKRAPGLKLGSEGFLDLQPDFIGFANRSVEELFSGLASELVSLCQRTAL